MQRNLALFIFWVAFAHVSILGGVVGEPFADPGSHELKVAGAPAIHLAMEGGQISAYLVDEEGLLVDPSEIISITLILDNPGKRNDDMRVFLQPGDLRLISPRLIPPPHDFHMKVIVKVSEDSIQTIGRIRFSPSAPAESSDENS